MHLLKGFTTALQWHLRRVDELDPRGIGIIHFAAVALEENWCNPTNSNSKPYDLRSLFFSSRADF